MQRLILFIMLCVLFLNVRAAEVVITPSEVFTEALLIEQETELIKNHLHITAKAEIVPEVKGKLLPRHVWQKGYMLQMKLNAFRLKQGLATMSPAMLPPLENLDPRFTWAQANRQLNEIRIIRRILGINGSVKGVSQLIEGKTPTDVYNKLNQIEAEWDLLSDAIIDSSYAFAQVMRLNEDVNTILSELNLFDNAVPPAKIPTSTPNDSLEATFLVLEQLQRLQKFARIAPADLSDFRSKPNKQVTPSEVFNMVCLLIAEVQTLKAELGIKTTTIAANYYDGKKPADTLQLLGYVLNKLTSIQSL